MAGTMHLRGRKVGKFVRKAEYLLNGEVYMIVDRGLNEWLYGYKYKGMDVSGKYHIFMDVIDPIVDEFNVYTEEEMDEMIALKEIAERG